MTKEHLGVRVDAALKTRIKRLVEEGEYRDYSDFTERAIREKLDREDGIGRAAFREQLIEAFKTDPEVLDVLRAIVDAARDLAPE